jgi:hypothetical protein
MSKKIFLLAVLLAGFLAYLLQGENISLFATDGCSVFPEGTFEQQTLWAHCCIEHDFSYWQGGTYNERLAADQRLEQCVSGAGEPDIAQLMLAGVRVGGSPYFPTSYRWGYGWSYPRGYKALTEDERKQIRTSLQSLEVLIASILHKLGGQVSSRNPYSPAMEQKTDL